jgi:glutamine---fructose-6-phosphate transaminase (isomerizing)
MNGRQFEAEIREQPGVLTRIAASDAAAQLVAAIGDRSPLFIGSGSSYFVAQLAMLAWHRAGRQAAALAASEARLGDRAQRDRCIVAISQSGRTADVLAALDALAPARTIALTNDRASPLGARADVTIDALAGAERAVPASKSVTAMAALALWSAARVAGEDARIAEELTQSATGLRAWLDGAAPAQSAELAVLLEPVRSIVIVGSGFGVPVASEIALKIKEASYRHAEGMGAGEFRHGSTAMLDPRRGVVGILDVFGRTPVEAVLERARAGGAAALTLGAGLTGMPGSSPPAMGRFAPLGWIAGGQMLALALARAAGIDSDAPRGLRKFLS